MDEVAEKTFKRKVKKRQQIKGIRVLREKRKVLKKMAKCTEGEEKKIIIARRKKIIMDYICQIKRAQKRRKEMEVAKRLKRERGFGANAFWKHAKSMKGRKKEEHTRKYS